MQLALGGRIVVDDASHVVDQLDGLLGQVVARGGLRAEEHGARHQGVRVDLAGLDVGVGGDDREDLQGLTLVLVQTLDHRVEHGVRVDVEAVLALGERSEVVLVGLLDLGELLDELRIIGQRDEALELLEVGQPRVGAQALGDEVGHARVGELDEAARGDTVGDVGELVRVHGGEVLEGDVLEQLGVQLGHTVDVGAAVGGEVRHADGSVLAVGVDAHTLDLVVSDALALQLGHELFVDLLDDLKVTRQQLADQGGRPHFQSFRKQCVAGVVEGLVGDGPSGIPVVAVLVDQDAHELRDADHRVGVVELEHDLVRQRGQVRVLLARVEHADRVVDGRGDEEVLLLEAQLLALRGGILRVEDLGDVLGFDLRNHSVEIFALVEGEQVELVVGLRGPQTQRVDAAGLVARNHVVARDGADSPRRLPHALAVLFDDFTAEVHALVTVVIDVAPRLFVDEPVIRGFDLLAVLVELLLEDAVLVTDAVTKRRHADGGERIDVAGSQTAETAVAQARFVFGVDDVLGVEAQLLHGAFELLGQAGVQQRVLQLLAHEELSAQVSNGLGVAVDHVMLGLHPRIHEVAAHGSSGGHIHISGGRLLRRHALGVLELLANLVGELTGSKRRLRCSDFGHYLTPFDGTYSKNHYA